MFGRLPGWWTMYTFSGALAPHRILPGAKFTLRPSLAFFHIGGVQHGTPAAGVSQSLRRAARNRIAELLFTQMYQVLVWDADKFQQRLFESRDFLGLNSTRACYG